VSDRLLFPEYPYAQENCCCIADLVTAAAFAAVPLGSQSVLVVEDATGKVLLKRMPTPKCRSPR
jgi:D-alanyl-D-alanine carboxypeptidase/D-alanyl-D-alanine endopeptidase (penicillin-binding protein 7)